MSGAAGRRVVMLIGYYYWSGICTSIDVHIREGLETACESELRVLSENSPHYP